MCAMGGPSSRDVDTIIRDVLDERFAEIEKASGRDVLVVYGPIVRGLDNLVHEALEAIPDRNPEKKLTLVLQTGGGVVEVVERMVETIRDRYVDVSAVIPDRAMSAGTIFALSCDSILMSDFSRLGPIDPQVERPDGSLVAALGYLQQLERLNAKDRDPKQGLSTAELALIQKLDLAELYEFEQAKELSIDLLKQWLTRYKFKDWGPTRTRKIEVTKEMKEERAEQVARELSNNARWHSHGRGISRRTLEEEPPAGLNIRIDKLENQPNLEKATKAYHDCLIDNLDRLQRLLHVQTRNFHP